MVQKMLDDTAVCKYRQKGLELVENVSASPSLGRAWKLTCKSIKCKKNYAMTPKKYRYFIVNRMLNFALRCVGKGHSAAKKIISLMNLHTPISSQHWRKHTKALSNVTEVLLEKNLLIEALN